LTDSGQSLALDSDNVTSITRDDWATGDSLYSWALKVNGINIDAMIRNGVCGCNHPRQAKFSIYAGAVFAFSREGIADDRNVRTGRDFVIGPELEKWQAFRVNLQESKVSDYRMFVDKYLGEWGSAVWKRNSDSATSLASLRVQYDMGSSQDPTVWGDDEASCLSICHVNANNGGHESLARLFLGNRILRGSERDSEQNANHHRCGMHDKSPFVELGNH